MNDDQAKEWRRACAKAGQLTDLDMPESFRLEELEWAARDLLALANQMAGKACERCKGAGKRLQSWGDVGADKYDICPDCGGSGERREAGEDDEVTG